MRLAYFSPVPWASFRQRPHEFVSWFHHRFGGPVLWIDPYPVRLPRWADLKRPAVGRHENPEAPPWLRVLRPSALPLEPLAAGRALNRAIAWPPVLADVKAFCAAGESLLAIGKPSDLALRALRALPGWPSLYDAMDDFSAFHEGLARRTAQAIEQQILELAMWRTTSSTHIAARMRKQGLGVEIVRNGLASDRMPDPTPAAGDAPFGYVGTVAAWFDWPWVLDLAKAFAHRRIEIHGPLFQAPPSPLPANVRLGPALAHAEALLRMRGFAAGLIPFRRNELTDSVDPVKFYEYRGLGLPVISTPFGEMRGREGVPGVLLTEQPSEASEAIAQLAGRRDTAESVAAFRKDHDWGARFDPLAPLIARR